MIVLICNFTVDQIQIRGFWALAGFTSVGALASVLAAAFQCPIPLAWETFSMRCFNQVNQLWGESGPGIPSNISQVRVWLAFGVFDALTDASIVGGSAVLVWGTRMALRIRQPCSDALRPGFC